MLFFIYVIELYTMKNSNASKVSIRKKINLMVPSYYSLTDLPYLKKKVLEDKLFYNSVFYTVPHTLYVELKTRN